LIELRFWWPEMEGDINWYVQTCYPCQLRQKNLPRAPLPVTYTPSMFQEFHVDMIHMTPASNGCNCIVHGRCALTAYAEARAVRRETARVLGQWLLEDVLCRWGCVRKIVTDNASQYKAAVAWLEQKYGIKGIQVSAYNSRANGVIE
jgi:hypothetical protein